MRYPAYPLYKKSRIDWVDQIPGHWQETSIKRYFSIQLGKMLQPQSLEQKDLEVSYLRAVNVQWESVNTNDLPKMWAAPDEIEKFSVKEGDLLICEGGEVGRTATLGQIEDPCIIQNALHRVRSTKNTSTAYLKYLMRHIADTGWFGILCNKTTIAHLTGEKLAEIGLPLAPLPEQQAIARFLDHKTAQIDVLIAKKEALLQKLGEKRTVLISQAVTQGLDPTVPMKDSGVAWLGKIPNHWETVRLGRKIMLQRGEDITKDEQTDGPVPVVSSGGISSFHNVPFAAAPGVIVGRKGTLGTVHYVETAYWPHDTTLWVKQFRGNIPRYVFYKLRAMDLASFDTGSANPTLNRNLLHPVIVSWPPIGEQRAIAAFLDHETDAISEMEVKVENAIDKLKEYRSALITAAVTGQIDVRGVSLPDALQQEAA